MPTLYEISTGIRFAPGTQLSMLFVSPHLELTGTGHSFRATNIGSQRQKVTINQCIQLMRSSPVQFLVFPEYSIPTESFTEIDTAIRATDSPWPPNSVVIGGLEPVSIQRFSKLLDESDNPTANKNPEVAAATYANLCCIWIKNNEGQVSRFIQPKQTRNRAEQATQGMYEGQFTLLFHADRLSFCTLVCLDCIGIPVADFISAITVNVAEGNSRNLNLLVAIQHNDRPEHPEFISFAESLLSAQPPLNTGLNSAIAFVNSANSAHGRTKKEQYGRSAIYYLRRGNWRGCADDGPLTFVPNTFAQEDSANTLVRTRFREDGPSAHRFSFMIPAFVSPSSSAPKYPLTDCLSFKLLADGSLGAPAAVPPLKKTFFDWVSSVVPVDDSRFNVDNDPVNLELHASYARVWNKLDGATSERLEQLTNLLMIGFHPAARPARFNPDSWQKSPSDWYSHERGQALLEFVSVVMVLELAGNTELETSDHTNSGKLGDHLFTIIDGAGKSTHVDLAKSYLAWLRSSSWGETVGTDNLLFITRTTSVLPAVRPEEILNFYRPSANEERSLGPGIAPDPQSILEISGRCYWCMAGLLRTAILNANNSEEAVASVRDLVQLEA